MSPSRLFQTLLLPLLLTMYFADAESTTANLAPMFVSPSALEHQQLRERLWRYLQTELIDKTIGRGMNDVQLCFVDWSFLPPVQYNTWQISSVDRQALRNELVAASWFVNETAGETAGKVCWSISRHSAQRRQELLQSLHELNRIVESSGLAHSFVRATVLWSTLRVEGFNVQRQHRKLVQFCKDYANGIWPVSGSSDAAASDHAAPDQQKAGSASGVPSDVMPHSPLTDQETDMIIDQADEEVD